MSSYVIREIREIEAPESDRGSAIPINYMKIEFEKAALDALAQSLFERIFFHLSQLQKEDVLMDVGQIAALLGKSRRQIYQWVHNASHGLSDFPYQKVGRSLRFSKE